MQGVGVSAGVLRREPFYEQRLALAFPWHCPERPEQVEGGSRWRIVWTPPRPAQLGGAVLPPQEIVLEPEGGVSFEQLACDLETRLCLPEHDLVCRCCLGELAGTACLSCRFAVGLHRCQDARSPVGLRWRKGTLYAGSLDAQRILWNLHRKGLPVTALRQKASLYQEAGLLQSQHVDAVILAIEQERGVQRLFQQPDEPREEGAAAEQNGQMTRAQLQEELRRREANMQIGGTPHAPTDQWRVYQQIVSQLKDGPFLRMLVQASAGTGKSYVLTSVFLWCILNDKRCKAAAPTGIASANIAVEGADVRASTIHNLFDFDGDMKTGLDFAKLSHPKVAELMLMEVLLVDEFSMLDTACWSSVEEAPNLQHKSAHKCTRTTVMHACVCDRMRSFPSSTTPSGRALPKKSRGLVTFTWCSSATLNRQSVLSFLVRERGRGGGRGAGGGAKDVS